MCDYPGHARRRKLLLLLNGMARLKKKRLRCLNHSLLLGLRVGLLVSAN